MSDEQTKIDRERILKHAAGMWKDREDLDDIANLRAEWDRFEITRNKNDD